jgi:hypothetical protein
MMKATDKGREEGSAERLYERFHATSETGKVLS